MAVPVKVPVRVHCRDAESDTEKVITLLVALMLLLAGLIALGLASEADDLHVLHPYALMVKEVPLRKG